MLPQLVSEYVAEMDVSDQYHEQLHRAAVGLMELDSDRPLTLPTVNAFLKKIAERYSRITARNYRSRIITIWHYAHERGLADQPDVRRIKRIKYTLPVPRALTKKQVRQLVESAETLKGQQAGIPNCLFWPALIVGAFDLGFRKGDLLRLPYSLIGQGAPFAWRESKEGRVQVRQLSQEGVQRLNRLQALNPTKEAYPWSLGLTSWRKHWAKIAGYAGIECQFKTLRKTHGSYAGTLGHASLAVFEKHYLDPTINPKPTSPGDL